MRLISYHIENYGKIQNQDGQFGEGVTEFCEKNGYGKTTLASFIRAMFYGLPSYTKSTKTFDDRQHFYPFNNGKFGGNITFEWQGKTYKIERFFDKKSGKGDEVKVYCDGALFTGFGENIGKAVFEVDEEAFKKTVFITADEIEIESTHSINEKLNRDVEGGDDIDFENAMKILGKAKKRLEAGRGVNDLINQTNTEVLRLNERLKNLNAMSDGLTKEYIERERLTKQIAQMDKEEGLANEREVILQKWKTLDNLTAQAEEKTLQLKGYETQYPGGLPTAEELEKMRSCIQEENRLTGSLQAVSFGADKEKVLSDLAAKFQNGAPRDEDIAQKQQNLTYLAAVKAEYAKLQNAEKTAREKDLEKRFSDKLPSEEELSQKGLLVEEYKQKEMQLKELYAAPVHTAPTQPAQTGKGKGTAVAGLSVVCFIAGIILFALQLIPVGIAALAVGVVGLIVSVAMMSKKQTGGVAQASEITLQIAKLQSDLKMLEEKIRTYTVGYSYYSTAGVVYDFATLEDDVRAYRAQLALTQENEQKAIALLGEMERITADTQAFLQQYGESGADLHNGLNRLLSMAGQYASLQADKEAASGKASDASARISQYKNIVSELLQKYGLQENAGTMYGLNTLGMDANGWKTAKAELIRLENNLANYKAENGLTERPADEYIDKDALRGEISKLRRELSDCDKRIAETEREVEQIPDVQSELERAEETLKLYKEKLDLLTETMDALNGADKTLKDKYIAPIKDKFFIYAEALERVLGEKVTMDSDYRVTFERGGENRSDRHLSAGERMLCALCLRLALIDNMYPGEQPFIVMDDPFVHLDEEHLKRTAELVRELSETRQIIYFCCHESRSVLNKM